MNMGWVSDKWYEFDIMHLKLSWGLYCQEEQIYQSALLLAYLKGQCPREANKGSGCQCCYGGHSQSTVCDHKAEPTHFQMTVQEHIMSQVCEWKCLSHKWGLQRPHAIWDTSSCVTELLNGFSKWCSTLPFASGRMHQLQTVLIWFEKASPQGPNPTATPHSRQHPKWSITRRVHECP